MGCSKEPRVLLWGFLYLFGFTCKSLQNESGGTRIRTGDTMIFSHMQRPLGMRIYRIGKRIYVQLRTVRYQLVLSLLLRYC
jgi:hypothetical protein